MSERNSGEVKLRKVNNDRRSGVVKSLILEFEQLQTVIVDPYSRSLSMGAEQSSSNKQKNGVKSPTVTSKTFVKQRVSQFNVENESLSDKRRRHKSTSEGNNNQSVPSKDFSRSVSADHDRREKDRYSRSRQITPKATRDSDKLTNPNRKHIGNTDSNNNSSQKQNAKSRTDYESTVKEVLKKNEKLANIKTSQKLAQRFHISENTVATLEKNGKSKTISDNIKKADPVKDSRQELNSRIFSKKKIRSVKSIRKVFETNGPKPVFNTVCKISGNAVLSESDTVTIGSDIVTNKNKINSNKHEENKEEISLNSVNLEKCNTNDHITENTTTNENEDNVENCRKNIVNNITREFHSLEQNGDYSYSEDEFNEIENSFHEMRHTIREMEELHSHNDLSTIKENENEVEPVVNACKLTDASDQEDLTGLGNEDIEEIENVRLYLKRQSISSTTEDDEFGKRSFGSLDNISFIEAYNRDGDELFITTVGAVEHRTVSGNFTSGESVISVEDEDPHDYKNSITVNVAAAKEPNYSENSAEDQFQLSQNVDSKNCLKEVIVIHYPASVELEDIEAIKLRSEQDAESGLASNRSTIYSNTNTNSTDSIEQLSKTESEDGIESDKDCERIHEQIQVIENHVEIRNNPSLGYERTIRTETFYDTFKNPRIAKVSNINSEEYMPKTEIPKVEEIEPRETPRSPTSLKPKKDYIIEELIDTEKKYIKHLEKVVWDYMPVITDENLPPSLIGKSRYLFGNIRKIYSATQKFYKVLKQCGNDHEEIAKIFLAYKHLFELYPLYSKSKPVADQYLLGDFKDIVAVRERQLNDRLGLASNLLTPIQRLGKYILFLEQIQKELKKVEGVASDNIYKAIETVRKQMSRGNDYIAIDSIKDCPISLLEQGSFIMREKFNVIKPRKYEAMVFLFEEILVLATVDPRNPEMFVYRESIKLNEMGIVTFDDQPLVFHLKRFPSYKKGPKEHHEFVLEAKKNKDKKTWTEQIEKRLWEQLVKCKEDQRELHNNQGKRNSVVELPDRTRRKKTGYSSLPSEMRKNPPKSIFYYKVDRDA